MDRKASVSITFRSSVPELMKVPEDAEWFLHYHGMAGLTHRDNYYFRAFDTVFRLNPATFVGECTVGPEMMANRRYFTHVFFTIVLFEILRYHGLYYIHGAALEKPAGPSILLPANACSGKSTLSVALIHNGFNYASDDAVFARMNGSGAVELVPFVREFHASPRLAEVFHELEYLKGEPEYFPGNDKRAFRGDDIYPGRFVKSIRSPDYVIFPKIEKRKSSELERLTAQQALTMMIPNSALVMFSREAAKRHLETLKKIVSGARCYRMKSGLDVYENPVSAVAKILESLESA